MPPAISVFTISWSGESTRPNGPSGTPAPDSRTPRTPAPDSRVEGWGGSAPVGVPAAAPRAARRPSCAAVPASCEELQHPRVGVGPVVLLLAWRDPCQERRCEPVVLLGCERHLHDARGVRPAPAEPHGALDPDPVGTEVCLIAHLKPDVVAHDSNAELPVQPPNGSGANGG